MIEAILLGLLQGISEFLPISSDGHLALAGMLFDIENAGLTLTILLHVGTLVATAIVLRHRLLLAIKSGLSALRRPSLFQTDSGGKDALFVIVASVPTALIGLCLRDAVESLTGSPVAVGLGFLLTGSLLVSTHFAKQGIVEHPTWKMAFLLGLAQGMAVLPGVSRSGSTIAFALFMGVKRERAFELSMLMSVPAVLGAVLLEIPGALHFDGFGFAMLGALVACISGIFSMLFVRRMVVGGAFPWFALWVFPVGIATLLLARS